MPPRLSGVASSCAPRKTKTPSAIASTGKAPSPPARAGPGSHDTRPAPTSHVAAVKRLSDRDRPAVRIRHMDHRPLDDKIPLLLCNVPKNPPKTLPVLHEFIVHPAFAFGLNFVRNSGIGTLPDPARAIQGSEERR